MYEPKPAGRRIGGPQSSQYKIVTGAQLPSTAEIDRILARTEYCSRNATEVTVLCSREPSCYPPRN